MDLQKTAPLPLASGLRPTFALTAASARDATVTRLAASALTSIHTWELACVARPPDEYVASLPGVDAAHLDGNGRVRIGTAVSPGMLLVAKTTPRTELTISPEERKLETLRREPLPARRDTSLRCPPDVRGDVTEVRVTDEKVTVVITLHRPLAIGDVLRAEGGGHAVVGEIVEQLPNGADLAWPGTAGQRVVDKIACAEDRSYARSIGPYSLVTQQPLGGRAQFGGQRLGLAAIRALIARGAKTLVHEMLTVKSDDVAGRLRLYESIVRGTPACVPGVPSATRVLEAELGALGFDVDLTAEQPTISLATTASIRARAPGVVRKPDTINYRTHKPVPEGLFCVEIFGAFGSEDRRTRLGRIELPVPVIHPWAVPAVATLLGKTLDDIASTLQEEGARGLRVPLEAIDLDALAKGTGPRADLARTMIVSGLRPTDFLLEAWPVLPPETRPLVALDGGLFATSDLNDLYRRLINRTNRLRRLLELNAPPIIVQNEILELQRAVETVVHNGRSGDPICFEERPLKSLVDLVAGPQGRFSVNILTKRVDYSAVAPVVERDDLAPDRARIPREMALELWKPWIFNTLEEFGHTTTIKASKALVVARDPLAYEALDRVVGSHPIVLLPQRDTGRVMSVDVELWDERAIALSPHAIQTLGLEVGDVVAVHVPCDPRALDEARRWLRSVRLVRADEEPDEGWIARASRMGVTQIGPVLFEAALGRERDPVKGTVSRLALGRPL